MKEKAGKSQGLWLEQIQFEGRTNPFEHVVSNMSEEFQIEISKQVVVYRTLGSGERSGLETEFRVIITEDNIVRQRDRQEQLAKRKVSFKEKTPHKLRR